MSWDSDGFYTKPKGKTKEYLVQNWGQDAGHACMGIFLTVVAWTLIPDHPYWAAAIGGTLYMIPKELYDIGLEDLLDLRPWDFSLDTFSDAVSYQWGFAMVTALHKGLGWGALVFAGITGVYLFLVWRKLR